LQLKINATTNFNAGAVIVTLKGNFLCKNMSYDILGVDH